MSLSSGTVRRRTAHRISTQLCKSWTPGWTCSLSIPRTHLCWCTAANDAGLRAAQDGSGELANGRSGLKTAIPDVDGPRRLPPEPMYGNATYPANLCSFSGHVEFAGFREDFCKT